MAEAGTEKKRRPRTESAATPERRSRASTAAGSRKFEEEASSNLAGHEAAYRSAHAAWIFSRLPPWVMDTLTPEQKEAIHHAVTDGAWGRHPINIRLSIPLLSRRFYLTVVGGEDKRGADRRAIDRNRYPLRTLANIFFFIGVATLFYMLALVGLAVHSTIVDF